MVVKMGRYGKFIACPGYPECKNILKYVEKTGVSCPKCGGDVIVKHTKSKRVFYGCSMERAGQRTLSAVRSDTL